MSKIIGSIGHSGGTGSSSAYNPQTLTAVGGVITPDATAGYGPHRYTATGDVTLAAPAGGADGEPLEVQVFASGADRTLTVAGASVLIVAGSWWWGHFSYVAATSTWLLDAASSGGGGGSSGSSLQVLVYSGSAYPSRPAVAAGLVRYIGPVQPSDWLTNDEWIKNA